MGSAEREQPSINWDRTIEPYRTIGEARRLKQQDCPPKRYDQLVEVELDKQRGTTNKHETFLFKYGVDDSQQTSKRVHIN